MRNRKAAAFKAWKTRRQRQAFKKARAAEAASKEALRKYSRDQGWSLAFFEGKTGAPRTGIVDAVLFRLGRRNPDFLDIRLVQLKGGNSGVSGGEVARLKRSVHGVTVNWLIAAFDGKALHLVPEVPKEA